MDTKQDLNKAIRIWQQHVHTPFFQLMVHVHGRLAVAWIGLCMTVQTPDEECMVGSAVRVLKKGMELHLQFSVVGLGSFS